MDPSTCGSGWGKGMDSNCTVTGGDGTEIMSSCRALVPSCGHNRTIDKPRLWKTFLVFYVFRFLEVFKTFLGFWVLVYKKCRSQNYDPRRTS